MTGLSLRCIRGLLLTPYDMFEELKSSTLTETYRFYVLMLLFYTILLGIVSVSTVYLTLYDLILHTGSIPLIGSFLVSKVDLIRPFIINWSIFIVYEWFFFLLFAIFLKGLFIHLFVILFGGKHEVVRTIQVLMYAVTPYFLFGWIPYIGVIGIIWAVILCIIGLIILQDLKPWEAIAVVATPSILVLIGLFIGILLILNLSFVLSHLI